MLKSICRSHNQQLSVAFITMFFLAMSGGLQDAYSYIVRGGVFANAQTGNLVLVGANLFSGNLVGSAKYFAPFLSFACGLFLAIKISAEFRTNTRFKWRQIILVLEIMLLFVVAFIPASMHIIANSIVSFSCAMQVHSFSEINGQPFGSTMCIGNLRCGLEALFAWTKTKDLSDRDKAVHYFVIIFAFAVGAGIGSLLSEFLGKKLILVSCVLLLICLALVSLEKS